jgi:ADP-ribose pyrophosphatase YjhB (NUDIX family)/Arc/MetJ-type ribon-helix-helix transcriptional regulator
MARITKVVGISLPPKIYQKLESLAKREYKTRSEFYREIIDFYLESYQKAQPIHQNEAEVTDEKDLAKILKAYWLVKSQFKSKVLIAGVGIIANSNGKVLIGLRNTKDKWVENLTWVFPGGKMESLDFEKNVKKKIKEETGLEVKVNSLVASRIHPDAGFKEIQIVIFYFYCTAISGQAKPGGDLVKIKWVRPTSVFKYFTSSTSDDVTKFLYTLEKSHQKGK